MSNPRLQMLGYASTAELQGGAPIEVRAQPEPGDAPVSVVALTTSNIGQMVWDAARALAEKKGGSVEDHVDDAQSALYAVGIEPRDELV